MRDIFGSTLFLDNFYLKKITRVKIEFFREIKLSRMASFKIFRRSKLSRFCQTFANSRKFLPLKVAFMMKHVREQHLFQLILFYKIFFLKNYMDLCSIWLRFHCYFLAGISWNSKQFSILSLFSFRLKRP